MAKNVIDFSKKKKVRMRMESDYEKAKASYEKAKANEIRGKLKDYGFVEKDDILVYEPDDGAERIEAKIVAGKGVCGFRVMSELENKIYCGGKIHEKGEPFGCYVPIILYAFPGVGIGMVIKSILTKFRIKKKEIEVSCGV